MPKKKKAAPIVPLSAPVPAPGKRKPQQEHKEAPVKKRKLAATGSKAVLWLQCNLRIRDNPVLACAAALGTGGLAIVVVWRHGRKVPTPAASFMAAAFRCLHSELQRLGNGLTVLIAAADSDEAAAEAVATYIGQFGDVPPAVVIDASGPSGAEPASLLQAALPSASVLPVLAADTLIPHDAAAACLPKSRAVAGVEDGARSSSRDLQWAGFLKAAAKLPVPPPIDAPASLPPPLTPIADRLPLPPDSAWWGKPTLDGWLGLSGAPISEESGLALASAAGVRAQRNGRNGFAHGNVGERAGAGDDAEGTAAPRPSYISAYLAWGVISPRQVAACGVRRRDLLWRDFSRLCWRLAPPLRHGEPVTQALPLGDVTSAEATAALERAAKLARAQGEHGWAWLLELDAPEDHDDHGGEHEPSAAKRADGRTDGLVPLTPACVAALAATSPSLPPPSATQRAERATALALRPPPTWRAILGLSDAEAFEAWCVGRTGAPLVDAGMTQLWACGWMPRRIRLLCAACLVEGLGLDWRLGRDWFAYALLDHDYAINETMWQNAGLCGVDPFYRGLQWEVKPLETAPADTAAATSTTASTAAATDASASASAPATADDDDEPSGYAGSERYARRWLDLPPLALPPWPPALHAAVARPRPPLDAVQHVAAARRPYLRCAYRRAGRVSRVGVRVVVQPSDATTVVTMGAAGVAASSAARPVAPSLHQFSPAAGGLAMVDSVGSAADEVVRVGHLAFRVPPIAHGVTWVRARKEAIAAVVAAAAPQWDLLRAVAHSPGGCAAHAAGVADAHSVAARASAATKLISNRAALLLDVTNPARWTNVEAKPLTQPELTRVHADLAPHVDAMLREVACRLLGVEEGSSVIERPFDASSAAQAAAWTCAARYVCGRLQGKASQKPGRTPDMDAKAAAAMRAVLRGVAGLHQRAVSAAGMGGAPAAPEHQNHAQHAKAKVPAEESVVAGSSAAAATEAAGGDGAAACTFVPRAMLRCARSECLYCLSVVVRAAGGRASLSARPESCLRVVARASGNGGGGGGGSSGTGGGGGSSGSGIPATLPTDPPLELYQRGRSILTVGDGDLSFSLALARACGGPGLVATSYESKESLRRIYGAACMETLAELRALGATIVHSVDAINLHTTLPVGCRPKRGFARCVWNFPCAVHDAESGAKIENAANGADARGGDEVQNRALISRFCAGAARLLADGGELHITHKVGLRQWAIPQQGDDSGQGLVAASTRLAYKGNVLFDRAAFPGYRPRKALEKSSFPTGDAQTFTFVKRAAGV